MNNKSWVIKAFLLTFFLALIMSGISNVIVENCGFIVLLIITIVILFIGIVSDIVGTAILTADEATFHAKASNKIEGSKESIRLIKNSGNIANFFNDIVGDVSGIISGSMGAMIAIYAANHFNISNVITALIVSAILSSVLVGGKAIGKNIAVKNSDEIIFLVGSIINKFSRKKDK